MTLRFISAGSHFPADIASGRAHIVRWTMVFAPTETECRLAEVRSRSMSCNCMTRTSQQECRGILEYASHTIFEHRVEPRESNPWA